MEQLQAVIKALDVTQVVWIDDVFSASHADTPPDPQTLAMVIAKDGTAAKLGIAFEEATAAEDIAARLDADTELFQRAFEMHRNAGLSKADQQMIRAIVEGIGVEITTTSGRDWIETLKQEGLVFSKTLFLVDRDYIQEQLDATLAAGLLSDTVKKFLMQSSSNYCVVLSKDVVDGNEQDIRKKMVDKIDGFADEKKAVLRFSAISKDALTAKPKEALAIRLTFGLGGVVLAAALDEVVTSLDAGIAELEGEIVYEFEDLVKGVLANAYGEGTSEVDVLLRILNQSHRLALAKSFRKTPDHPLKALLHQFRRFQLENAVVPKDHKMAPDGLLQKLGMAEMITEGQIINSLRLPIVPGDVFEVLGPDFKAMKPLADTLVLGRRFYMLLGQACDIVARGKDGKTRARLAFLAPFKVKTKEKKREDDSDFDVTISGRKRGVELNEIAMAFDFGEVLIANIAALQFVAFNADGYARLTIANDPDEGWALPSMMRARKDAVDKLRGLAEPPDELSRYAVTFDGKDATERKLVITAPAAGDSVCAYRIRRVCRVRDLEAVEALLGIQRYWARIAKPMGYMK